MRTSVTYVSALTTAIENPSALSAEEVEKLVQLKESIAKRNATKSDKPTKAQRENAEIAEQVAEAMVPGTTYSLAEISALVPALNGATSQKVGPLMDKLAKAGRATKSIVKGKAYYTLA